MDQENTQQKKSRRFPSKTLNGYAYYTGMGFQMIAIIGVFTYAGHRIDRSGGGAGVLYTALLSLVGVFISLYVVIRSVTSRSKKNDG